MKTIVSRIKYYSYIIFPVLAIIACLYTKAFLPQADIVANASVTLLGVMLTVLTLYVSVPNKEIKEKLKKYYHETIMIRNIITGLMLYGSSALISIFIPGYINWATAMFLGACTNVIISIYYITAISRYS